MEIITVSATHPTETIKFHGPLSQTTTKIFTYFNKKGNN